MISIDQLKIGNKVRIIPGDTNATAEIVAITDKNDIDVLTEDSQVTLSKSTARRAGICFKHVGKNWWVIRLSQITEIVE